MKFGSMPGYERQMFEQYYGKPFLQEECREFNQEEAEAAGWTGQFPECFPQHRRPQGQQQGPGGQQQAPQQPPQFPPEVEGFVWLGEEGHGWVPAPDPPRQYPQHFGSGEPEVPPQQPTVSGMLEQMSNQRLRNLRARLGESKAEREAAGVQDEPAWFPDSVLGGDVSAPSEIPEPSTQAAEEPKKTPEEEERDAKRRRVDRVLTLLENL